MKQGKKNTNDFEYRVMHKLKGQFSAVKIAQFLDFDAGTVRNQLANEQPPSERDTEGKKPGQTPVISDAMKYNIILPLLEETNWKIQAITVHKILSVDHGIDWSIKTTERCVSALRIETGREKAKKSQSKKKTGRGVIGDDEQSVIKRLAKHFDAKSIAKLMDRSVGVVRTHIKDPQLPSVRRKNMVFRGRQTDILAGKPKAIIEAELKKSNWTVTGVQLHQMLVAQFPQLKKAKRSVQRYAKIVRMEQGPEKQIYTEQKKIPGEKLEADFKHFAAGIVTITGTPFAFCLLNIALSYSSRVYSKVVHGGESFQALNEGMLEAVQDFKGVPYQLTTDSLSAAYKNLSKQAKLDFTERFKQLCDYLGIDATRHNPNCPHEKGCVESINRHFADYLINAIFARRSNDFNSVEAFIEFVQQTSKQYNARNQDKFMEEQSVMQSLPTKPFDPYQTRRVWVSKYSGFTREHTFYSVPTPLSNNHFDARFYQARIDLYYQGKKMYTVPRRVGQPGKRTAVIHYAHMLDHFRKRPGSFKDFKHLDDFFPAEEYQLIYERSREERSAAAACRYVIGLLTIAHEKNCEQQLAKTIKGFLDQEQLPQLSAVQSQFGYQPKTSYETDALTNPTPLILEPLLVNNQVIFPGIKDRLTQHHLTILTLALNLEHTLMLTSTAKPPPWHLNPHSSAWSAPPAHWSPCIKSSSSFKPIYHSDNGLGLFCCALEKTQPPRSPQWLAPTPQLAI